MERGISEVRRRQNSHRDTILELQSFGTSKSLRERREGGRSVSDCVCYNRVGNLRAIRRSCVNHSFSQSVAEA